MAKWAQGNGIVNMAQVVEGDETLLYNFGKLMVRCEQLSAPEEHQRKSTMRSFFPMTWQMSVGDAPQCQQDVASSMISTLLLTAEVKSEEAPDDA